MNQKTKNIVLLLIVLSIILFAFILGILGVFKGIEAKFLDLRLSINNSRELNNNIVRLYLDDLNQYDLKQHNDFQGNQKYLSRSVLAKLIKYVEQGAPSMVIVNFDLANYEDPALSNISPDIILADTLKQYKNIILSSTLKKDASVDNEFADATFEPADDSLSVTVNDKDIDKNITYYSHAQIPDIFVNNATIAVPNVISDRGYVRFSKPVYKIIQHGKNYYLPSIPFAAFLKVNKLEKQDIVIENGKLYVKNYEISLNSNGEAVLNLNARKQYYTAYPIGSILSGIYGGSTQFKFNEKNYGKEVFKGKIVIIEETPENISIKSLPNGEKLTEAEINATIIDSYLKDANLENPKRMKFAEAAPMWLNILLAIIFCCLVSLANLKFNNRWLGAGMIVLYLLINIILFAIPSLRLWVLAAIPLYFMIVTFIMTYALSLIARREKRNIVVDAFKDHVSKDIMKKIVRNYQKISLKPDRKYITVMYCNINEFTPLTDMIPSELLIERLNEVLDIIIQVSFKNNGTVNKLNNNSVIAYWGAPLPSGYDSEDDAKNAIKSAIEIQNIISLINEQYEANNQFTLDLRVAVHSGEALVGSIGTQNMSSYTAFGETIDTVYKVEKICNQFKKTILVSETSYNLLKSCKNPKLSDRTIEFGYAGAVSNKTASSPKLSLYEVKEIPIAQDEDDD